MIVCHCEGIREKQIQDLVSETGASMKQVARQLNIGRDCGRCLSNLKSVMDKMHPHLESDLNKTSLGKTRGPVLFYAA